MNEPDISLHIPNIVAHPVWNAVVHPEGLHANRQLRHDASLHLRHQRRSTFKALHLNDLSTQTNPPSDSLPTRVPTFNLHSQTTSPRHLYHHRVIHHQTLPLVKMISALLLVFPMAILLIPVRTPMKANPNRFRSLRNQTAGLKNPNGRQEIPPGPKRPRNFPHHSPGTSWTL